MKFATTNYDDFRALIRGLFAERHVVFFGHHPPPRENEWTVWVTDNGPHVVVFTCIGALPETFNNDFLKAIALAEGNRLELGA